MTFQLFVGIAVPQFTERRRMETIAISGMSGFLAGRLCTVLEPNYKIQRVTQDLLYSPKDLNEFFRTVRPSFIIHAAAYGNMSNQKDEAMTVMANLIGTFNILKESLAIPYRGLLNFSSSSVYGQKDKPMAELDLLVPETMYGASKAGAEHLAYAFAKQHDKPIVSIRPFSVYGEGEADFRFIPTAIRNILTNKAFPLDEQAKHDWIHVEDFTKGVLLVMDNIGRIPNRVINIGTGRQHTNKEVVDLLKQISGIQYLATPMLGLRPNDSQIWMSDNTQISNLGFVPQVMLKEGLERTFNYYKAKYEKVS
jgi:nucleoside-diphosphate-sugar epimerase